MPAATYTPEHVEKVKSILSGAQIPDEVKAKAWDAYFGASDSKGFEAGFDPLVNSKALPSTVAADLYDTFTAASPQAPSSQPVETPSSQPPTPPKHSDAWKKLNYPGPALVKGAKIEPVSTDTIGGNVKQFLKTTARLSGREGMMLSPDEQAEVNRVADTPLLPLGNYVSNPKSFTGGVAQKVQEMSTPAEIGKLGAIAGGAAVAGALAPPVIPALEAFFGAQAAYGAASAGVKAADAAFRKGDYAEAARQLGYGSIDALAAAVLGTKGVKGLSKQVRARVEANPNTAALRQAASGTGPTVEEAGLVPRPGEPPVPPDSRRAPGQPGAAPPEEPVPGSSGAPGPAAEPPTRELEPVEGPGGTVEQVEVQRPQPETAPAQPPEPPKSLIDQIIEQQQAPAEPPAATVSSPLDAAVAETQRRQITPADVPAIAKALWDIEPTEAAQIDPGQIQQIYDNDPGARAAIDGVLGAVAQPTQVSQPSQPQQVSNEALWAMLQTESQPDKLAAIRQQLRERGAFQTPYSNLSDAAVQQMLHVETDPQKRTQLQFEAQFRGMPTTTSPEPEPPTADPRDLAIADQNYQDAQEKAGKQRFEGLYEPAPEEGPAPPPAPPRSITDAELKRFLMGKMGEKLSTVTPEQVANAREAYQTSQVFRDKVHQFLGKPIESQTPPTPPAFDIPAPVPQSGIDIGEQPRDNSSAFEAMAAAAEPPAEQKPSRSPEPSQQAQQPAVAPPPNASAAPAAPAEPPEAVGTPSEEPAAEPERPNADVRGSIVRPAASGDWLTAQPGQTVRIPTDMITADPARFQYKQGMGQKGVDDRFKNVTAWNDDFAGRLAVWRDPKDGKTYVINGHHRLEMAQRLGQSDVEVRYIRADTPEEARAYGAMINIAEDQGTPIDAAKIFRDLGFTREDAEKAGISLKGRIATDGWNLAQLTPGLFRQVVDGEMSISRGALIGRYLGDRPADQDQLAKLMEGRRMSDQQLEETLNLMTGRNANRVTEVQDSLFGTTEEERSTVFEEGDLSDYIKSKLKNEKKLFGLVGKQGTADELSKTGNVLNVGENAAVADKAAQLLEVYDKLKTMAGPVADALGRGARELAGGGNAKQIRERTYAEVRDAIEGILTGKPSANAAGPAGDAGTGGLQSQPERDAGTGSKAPAQPAREPQQPAKAAAEKQPAPEVVKAAEPPKPPDADAAVQAILDAGVKGKVTTPDGTKIEIEAPPTPPKSSSSKSQKPKEEGPKNQAIPSTPPEPPKPPTLLNPEEQSAITDYNDKLQKDRMQAELNAPINQGQPPMDESPLFKGQAIETGPPQGGLFDEPPKPPRTNARTSDAAKPPQAPAPKEVPSDKEPDKAPKSPAPPVKDPADMTKAQALQELIKLGVTDIQPEGKFTIRATPPSGIPGIFDPRDLVRELRENIEKGGTPNVAPQGAAEAPPTPPRGRTASPASAQQEAGEASGAPEAADQPAAPAAERPAEDVAAQPPEVLAEPGATGQRLGSDRSRPAAEPAPSDGRAGSERAGDTGVPGGAGRQQVKPKGEVKKPTILTVGNPPNLDTSKIPRPKTWTLYPHQEQAIAASIRAMSGDTPGERGFLNAGGTGSGKSANAAAVARHFIDQGKTVIIAGPAEVFKFESSDEAMPHSSYKDWFEQYDLKPNRINSKGPKQLQRGQLYVTTYDPKALTNVEGAVDDNTVIVFDESHALKNLKGSTRGDIGLSIIDKAHATLLMTATPADKTFHIAYLKPIGIMEGKPEEQALKDLGIQRVTRQNKKTGQKVDIWQADPKVGMKKVRENFAALFSRMIEQGRMRKEEIALDNMEIGVEEVQLPEEAAEVADLIERELTGRADAKNIMMHQRRQQEPFKIAATIEYVKKELADGRKVAVFVNRVNRSDVTWKEKIRDQNGEVVDEIEHLVYTSEGTAKTLKEELKKAGIDKVAEIHGGALTKTGQKQKSAEGMRQFQEGEADVVIATAPSGGTGIDLDDKVGDAPRSIIVMTPEFDAMNNVQLMGRIYRMSTVIVGDEKARVKYLFANSDIDRWNARKLSSKIKVLSSVVQGEALKMDVGQFFEEGFEPEEDAPKEFGGSGGARKSKAPKKLRGKRYGEYIEFFDDNARRFSEITGIPLRQAPMGGKVAGFPVAELEQYRKTLNDAGLEPTWNEKSANPRKMGYRYAIEREQQASAQPPTPPASLMSNQPPVPPAPRQPSPAEVLLKSYVDRGSFYLGPIEARQYADAVNSASATDKRFYVNPGSKYDFYNGPGYTLFLDKKSGFGQFKPNGQRR